MGVQPNLRSILFSWSSRADHPGPTSMNGVKVGATRAIPANSRSPPTGSRRETAPWQNLKTARTNPNPPNSADFADAPSTRGRSDSVVNGANEPKPAKIPPTCGQGQPESDPIDPANGRKDSTALGNPQAPPKRSERTQPRTGNAEDSAAVPRPSENEATRPTTKKRNERNRGVAGLTSEIAETDQIPDTSTGSRDPSARRGVRAVQTGRSPSDLTCSLAGDTASGGLIPAEKLSQRA